MFIKIILMHFFFRKKDLPILISSQSWSLKVPCKFILTYHHDIEVVEHPITVSKGDIQFSEINFTYIRNMIILYGKSKKISTNFQKS